MGISFIGYVLPINQISYWGCLVITSIFREIPYLGPNIVTILWGGNYIRLLTINRFFRFHFILPFILLVIIFLHILFLHDKGRRNPVGVRSKYSKIPFSSYSSKKDIFILFFMLFIFISLVYFKPLLTGDNDNFVLFDPLETPHHIQPEWYFLFAYAILRCIPTKLGGVLALVSSVIILFFLPYMYNKNNQIFNKFYKIIF